jgi:hypothetical protein
MGRLFECYRQQVFEPLNYADIYEESCLESIKEELNPALAERLVNDHPLTQKQKRKVLVATNEAIESRLIFSDQLEQEQESLQMVQEALLNIEGVLEELPTYSLQQLQFTKAIDIWETCEELITQCDQLATKRQRRFRDRQLTLKSFPGPHAFNEYLYTDLETQLPVLSAITGTRKRIERYRNESTNLDGRCADERTESVVTNRS